MRDNIKVIEQSKYNFVSIQNIKSIPDRWSSAFTNAHASCSSSVLALYTENAIAVSH